MQLLFTACTTTKHVEDSGTVLNVVSPVADIIQNDNAIESTVDIPDSDEKRRILSLFNQSSFINSLQLDYKELACMTEVMYFEARGEGDEGMLAVGYVVLNRVADDRFPKTICGVVKQGKHVKGKPVRYKCQFTWYCDGLPDVVTDQDSYLKATELALEILTGKSNNPVSNSLFYHAVYVRPRWSRVFAMVKRINKHLFYTYKNLLIAYK
jgi:spore germination cell wall hydrolase CwlJ-like protein